MKTKTTNTLNKLFRDAEKALNEYVIERAAEVRGMFLAILCSEHVFELGKAGLAKSMLAEAFAFIFEANFFGWQFSRHTNPDDIFGAVDITALKAGHVKRVTDGKLAWASIAHLDEVFRGSSAVLDTTNAVLHERKFYNNGGFDPCPLITAIAAANVLPEDGLEANYDRYLFRFHVETLTDSGMEKLLARVAAGYDNQAAKDALPVIGMPSLVEAQAEVASMVVDITAITPAILKIRFALSELPEPIYLSPRRLAKAIRVMQANAWLDGRSEATLDDLSVLNDILWNTPDQIAGVRSAVAQFGNPLLATAQTLATSLDELLANVSNALPGQQRNEAASHAFTRGRTALAEIDKAGTPSFAVATIRRSIAAKVKSVCVNELGMSEAKAEAAVAAE